MSTGPAAKRAERRAEREAARAAEDDAPAIGLEINEEALQAPDVAMGEQACYHPLCVLVAWQ